MPIDVMYETMKLAEDMGTSTHPRLLDVLQVSSPEEMLLVEDSLSQKYKWGDYAHPLQVLRSLRSSLGRKYGNDWAEWDPAVLIKYVQREFGEINELTRQKIYALQVVLTTDIPWQDFDVFENTALAFTNQIPLWGVLEPLDLHEMAFTIGILDAIRDEQYDDDVLGYVTSVMLYNGVIAQPGDSKLPKVDHIIRRHLDDDTREIANFYKEQWDDGNRTFDSDEDALDVQLDKFQLLEEWYNAGHNYVAPGTKT